MVPVLFCFQMLPLYSFSYKENLPTIFPFSSTTFGKNVLGHQKHQKMFQPQALRPVCTYSLQNNWSPAQGGWSCRKLSHLSSNAHMTARGFFLHMSKPTISPLWLVFVMILKTHFSHSVCIIPCMLLFLQYPPATLTPSASELNASFSPCDRAAAGPGCRGTAEGCVVWCVFVFFFPFACDTLFPFTSKRFLQGCLPGTRCCSCWMPWLLGLGSCTALIQFATQLHNCSQSLVDLDVKQRSSCTNPEKGGGISGQPLRTF